MPAPLCHKFWKPRKTAGRPSRFDSLEGLEDLCIEYFEWADSTPILQRKVYHYKGKVIYYDLPKMRPFSLKALCLFLRIDLKTWQSYKKKEDYSVLINRVELIIRGQQFEGAVANLFKANIISHMLWANAKDPSCGF